MRRPRGVTLLELLIAMAMAALVLALLGGMLASARSADGALSQHAEPRAALALAAELLREEIGLAGYEPYDEPTLAGTAPDPPAAPAVPAAAALPVGGAASDDQTIRVAFIDPRLAGGPVTRDLSFSTDIDSRGEAQLYRRSGTSSRQPLVSGISALRVASYVDALGVQPLQAGAAGVEQLSGVRALVVELTAPTGESRRLLVELPSRPSLRVEP